MPTVAERIDPKSPHYDAAFAELRRKAFGAWEDHKQDQKTKRKAKKPSEFLRRNGVVV
jgi:hypothetical protein